MNKLLLFLIVLCFTFSCVPDSVSSCVGCNQVSELTNEEIDALQNSFFSYLVTPDANMFSSAEISMIQEKSNQVVRLESLEDDVFIFTKSDSSDDTSNSGIVEWRPNLALNPAASSFEELDLGSIEEPLFASFEIGEPIFDPLTKEYTIVLILKEIDEPTGQKSTRHTGVKKISSWPKFRGKYPEGGFSLFPKFTWVYEYTGYGELFFEIRTRTVLPSISAVPTKALDFKALGYSIGKTDPYGVHGMIGSNIENTLWMSSPTTPDGTFDTSVFKVNLSNPFENDIMSAPLAEGDAGQILFYNNSVTVVSSDIQFFNNGTNASLLPNKNIYEDLGKQVRSADAAAAVGENLFFSSKDYNEIFVFNAQNTNQLAVSNYFLLSRKVSGATMIAGKDAEIFHFGGTYESQSNTENPPYSDKIQAFSARTQSSFNPNKMTSSATNLHSARYRDNLIFIAGAKPIIEYDANGGWQLIEFDPFLGVFDLHNFSFKELDFSLKSANKDDAFFGITVLENNIYVLYGFADGSSVELYNAKF